ncbi:3-hydroxymyristoyl/3-hydroxydecanoyl-(acyl carrier protein) dehydratase [Flavobacterium nitrogenifigens]|uniref:3-hydroxymyristoyl/3-hydroxydecanoyl-(Acyl carrier protein) dehydratase n=2 Tax=Flavobacterium TaxID=237 RepID=A0A7W7IUF6_9FLAO|nr:MULTISPECIES: ABC transporter permease [Flavobacterium]MBB4800766.1 3-hydroxymyristoyl/3-hydroxydecanoyl-(acyl carrier protein) dehydratase [Flavobacterium nitrogenifigens]MBB6385486.1 3-hydroxymyristoyl/3-hydroxydecanoyl-(acyl carrier protein) dehydratase [Flavobacterium notoginsengisoli]
MILNKGVDIQNYLPHRAPMLMVDLILDIDANFVETIFLIKEDNIFVQNNVFIEAGLIENTAQTCSSIVGKKYFFDEDGTENENVNVIGFISALKNVKIHSLPKVGETIITKATLVSKFVGDDYTLCTMSCNSSVEDQILLECEINLFIQKTVSIVE